MASTLKTLLISTAGLGLTLGLATIPAFAQSNDGFSDLSGDADSNEVFGGSGVSLSDLINAAGRSDGLDPGEFNEKTGDDINDAAADFRQRQQEAFEAQQGAGVDAPDVDGEF